MTNLFDQHGINKMLEALAQEMAPQGTNRRHETDTLFCGGPAPTEDEQIALARFGLSKNYNMIHAAFDVAAPDAGPTGFHAVVTDGLTEAAILKGGRLWKRDNRTAAVLVFADISAVVKMSAKRRFVVREMKAGFHAQGYELAAETLRTRATWKAGRAAVVSTIGTLPIVLDMGAFADTFAAAA